MRKDRDLWKIKRINNSNKNGFIAGIDSKRRKEKKLILLFHEDWFCTRVTCTLAFEHMSVTRFRGMEI